MTFRKAYLNIVHGDDTTAALDKAWLPFRTLDAALASGRAVAIPGEVRVDVIDQGAVNPAQFAPDPRS